MKNFRERIEEIYREHRGLFVMMILLVVLALGFFIFSLATLSPSSAVVKVGYSDIGSFEGGDLVGMRSAGGYRDGSWGTMITFPILALIVAVVHNLIAMRLCKRRGEGAAKAFILISMVILAGAFIVLLRLLGEG